MTTREYRGYTLGQYAEGLWAYRAHTWDMWAAPMTLAECKAAIDAELARYSTPTRENVRITQSGLARIPGAKVGDVYLVDHFSRSGDNLGFCAHVRDYSTGQSCQRGPFVIWTLGPGDWE